VQELDDLGTMFIKRIARMHRRGKEALERLHLQRRNPFATKSCQDHHQSLRCAVGSTLSNAKRYVVGKK
jgi:hypothetical protein